VTQLELCNMALSKIGSEGGLISSLAESSKEAVLCNQFYTPALNEVLQLHPWKCAIKRAELKAVTHKSTSSDAVPSELQTTLYWYDSGLTNAGEKVYYDLSGTYAIWAENVSSTAITPVDYVGDGTASLYFQLDHAGSPDGIYSGDYTGDGGDCSGTITVAAEDPVFRWGYHFRIPSGCLRPLALFDTDEREENYQIEWDREGDWIMSDSEEVWLVYVGTPTVDEMDAAFQKVLYTNLAIKLAYPMTQDRVLVNTLHQEYEELVLPEARRMNSFIGHRFEFNDSEWLDTRTNMYRPFANMSYGTIGD
jgi:hypothetical protein